MTSQRPADYLRGAEIQVDEQVFKNVFIPRTLTEIDAPMADIQQLQDGEGQDLMYKSVTGVNVHVSKEQELICSNDVFSELSSSGDDSEVGNSDTEEVFVSRNSKLKKHEDKDEKKERKALVKLENKEKRMVKTKKSDKKRKQNVYAK